MKTFTKLFLLVAIIGLIVYRTFGADITPGYTAPFQNGQTINAATLNQALAGTVNGTFYTGKSAETGLDAQGDLFLVWSTASSVYKKITATNALANIVATTNLIGGLNGHTLTPTNTQLVIVFDPVTPEVYKITIKELLTNVFTYNHNQLGYSAANEFQIASGSNQTNGALTTPTINGGILTNSYATNSFTIGSTNGGTPGVNLQLFDASGNVVDGARDWDINVNGGLFEMSAWDNTHTTGQNFFAVSRQAGNTNITALFLSSPSNGVVNFVKVVPLGLQVGSSGTPISQVNTYDSGTNNAIPAAGGALTNAHGFPGRPTSVRVVYVNVTAELGYSAGDEINVEDCFEKSAAYQIFQVVCDATNITTRRNSAATTIEVLNKGTGARGDMTEGNWKMRIYAQYLK